LDRLAKKFSESQQFSIMKAILVFPAAKPQETPKSLVRADIPQLEIAKM
jgi:hypothetical protein